MSIQFFGQFLLDRGELDGPQLRQALDLMEQENPSLGEMAVAAGFASAADCRRVHGEQRRKDLPFGELAVQMGVLNRIELEELLQIQSETRLALSGALVRLGLLQEDRVQRLFDEWKSGQSEDDPQGPPLPEALVGHRAAEATLRALRRMLLRVATIDARVGPGAALDGPTGSGLAASMNVAGLHGLGVTLVVDESFGVKLAEGLLGQGLGELGELASELALEAVGEFLNVLLGNVVSELEREALELRLEPPRFGGAPEGGFGFEIATQDAGSARLVLEVEPDTLGGSPEP